MLDTFVFQEPNSNLRENKTSQQASNQSKWFDRNYQEHGKSRGDEINEFKNFMTESQSMKSSMRSHKFTNDKVKVAKEFIYTNPDTERSNSRDVVNPDNLIKNRIFSTGAGN